MRHILLCGLLFFCGYTLQAQVNSHAIGLRLGGNDDANEVEISYQHGFNSTNRLELDLGFRGGRNYDRLFITGMYHWVWTIDGGFNWYAGPGAAISFRSYDNDQRIDIGLGGQVGVEYDFNYINAPLLVSLDIRPLWDFLGDYNGFGWGLALGIRYAW